MGDITDRFNLALGRKPETISQFQSHILRQNDVTTSLRKQLENITPLSEHLRPLIQGSIEQAKTTARLLEAQLAAAKAEEARAKRDARRQWIGISLAGVAALAGLATLGLSLAGML